MSILSTSSKFINPIQWLLKKPLFSVLSLGIAAIGITLLKTEPASAYCVYNESGETITAVQLPIKGDSFKAVIEPGEDSCCNWKDTSCTSSSGRYDSTSFLLYEGALDIDGITAAGGLGEFTSIVPGIEDVAEKITEKFHASGHEFLGGVTTFNGGVVWYDGNKPPVGCWTGPCRGQNINNDGSTGFKTDD